MTSPAEQSEVAPSEAAVTKSQLKKNAIRQVKEAISRSTMIESSPKIRIMFDEVDAKLYVQRRKPDSAQAGSEGAWSSWPAVMRARDGKPRLVFGAVHADGNMHPLGHAELRGKTLLFSITNEGDFPCPATLDHSSLKAFLSPPGDKRRPSSRQDRVSNANAIVSKSILSTPALRAIRMAQPSQPTQALEDEVEDGLTELDLARLRGDTPMNMGLIRNEREQTFSRSRQSSM
jgi:hypothetical protein